MAELDTKKKKIIKSVNNNNNGSVLTDDDLLEQIFVRLPHLRHCRMVCKRWRSVISRRRFIAAFKRHHPDTLPFTLLLSGAHGDGASIDFFSPDSHGKKSPHCTDNYLKFLSPNNSNDLLIIKCSFNDLLLVQLSLSRGLFVCNPYIKGWVKLPIPPRPRFGEYYTFMYGLVLDPNSAVEYSIVRFGCLGRVAEAHIFRSETGRWDEEVVFFAMQEGLSLVGVPVGASSGVLYCAIAGSRPGFGMKTIMSFDPFDPKREHYGLIDLPNGFSRGWMASCNRSGIGIVQGKLRLWQFYMMEEAGCFVLKVWELINSGCYWVIVHDARPRAGLPFSVRVALRALHPCNGHAVFLVEYGTHNVWQYHIGRGSCEKICEFDKDWTCGHIYTLVRPPCLTTISGMKRYGDISVFVKFMTSILPDELLLEIFVRLPDLLSAWHCRRVCQRWRSVISRGYRRAFKRHYSLHRRPDSLPFTLLLRGSNVVRGVQLRNPPSMDYFSEGSQFLCGKPSPNSTDNVNFLPCSSKAMIRCSFDDLLLVQWMPSFRLYVCNPLTKRRVTLPQPAPPPFLAHSFNYGLVLDPHSGEASSVKYSIVKFGCMPGSLVQALIFRSETGQWDEQVPSFPLEKHLSLLGVPVGASNGVLYCGIGIFESDFVLTRIAAFDPFDPKRKHYSLIDLPGGYDRERPAHCHHSGIGVVQGKLRLWQFYVIEEAGCFVVKVWELNSGGYWVTMHDARSRMEALPFSIHAVVRALHPCDGDVMFLLEAGSRNVWQYHIRRGSCDKICELDKNWTSGHIYALVHPPCSTRIPSLPPANLRLNRAPT